MRPSNPDNQQPLIYRIADALGVFHLVAPVDHTHTYAEVPGLADELNELWAGLNEKANSEDVTNALASKANAVHAGTPSGGIVIANTAGELSRSPKTVKDLQDAIDTKANETHGHDSIGGTATAQDASVECERDTVNINAENEVVITIEGQKIHLNVDNYENLVRALTNPDSTPTTNSNKLVTSGGVKAAIDALTTSVVPIHQVAAILPKTRGQGSGYELHSWLGDGKMALVLQTARPVEVSIEATGVDDAPDGTWRDSTNISFDLTPGVRTVKNIYDLISAQLSSDYPDEFIGAITNWEISVYAKDTVGKDTACLINFYNPTSAE